MGLDWARQLQHCLVAWAATGQDAYADTAMTYFIAQLDDLAVVGDGKGGDHAARRDSGFAIRAMGPYTALAYDWLHDHPRMTEALRARARQRFAAWTTWYLASGYRARSPATNYHAGYLTAVTFIAVAQRGDAGPEGDALWRLVRDEIWGKDMTAALAPGGILDGGDWAEGWQYAPLSVVEYAISARVMSEQGVKVERLRQWLDDLVRRHVYSLSPGGGVFVGGDTGESTANLAPNYLTVAAAIIGGASPEAQAWAAHEIERLKLVDEWGLFGALVDAAAVTAQPARRDWPTTYLARGVGAFFTRSHWGKDAVWAVLQCSRAVDADHVHANAGNLVISRGGDDLVVDPTPYGSLSSLTSNAPTVGSKHLPDDYKPSQAFWGEKTGFAWARQTASGVVVARCDYADQYKFQDRPSDVPAAIRDIVMVPWQGGKDATVVVVDRAESGDPARGLHLRFRTEAKLARDGEIARGTRGSSSLTLQRLWSSGGAPEVRSVSKGDCFSGATRGGCEAARFPVEEWRLQVPGPAMEAAHVIDVAAASAKLAPAAVARQGKVQVITAERAGARMVVVVGQGSYTGPADARHVVLDAPANASVSAASGPGGCAVSITSGGRGSKVPAAARVFYLDATCALTAEGDLTRPLAAGAEPEMPVAAGPSTATGGADGGELARVADLPEPGGYEPAPVPPTTDGPLGATPRSPRSGCCGAQATPGSPLGLTGVVFAWWVFTGVRRRRRAAPRRVS